MKILIITFILFLSLSAFGKTFEMPECGTKSDKSISNDLEICDAVQKVADKLNRIEWSNEFRPVLLEVWNWQDVRIYTQKSLAVPGYKGKNIWALAIFLGESGFIKVQTKRVKKSYFDAILIHELAHLHHRRLYGAESTHFEGEVHAFRINMLMNKESPKGERSSVFGIKWKDKYGINKGWQKPIKKHLKKWYRFDENGNSNRLLPKNLCCDQLIKPPKLKKKTIK